MSHVAFTDLAAEVTVAAESTLSRTIYQDDQVKVVLFAFAAGQELSEHTASMPAILHFIQGEAAVTLGSQQFAAQANSWVHMPANLPHSIVATTPVTMLLTLLKRGE
ncbi:MAG: cupin [Candidatus Viridilinea halotolerans]|uniref:Cupin n=1 Tax=Candidatus Viridilinea halotolerans TaxID=2491704 RepID=A0A426TY05_9CHLR|nr:MAG: cupin [Candidatus Viridilinea halotolerans]